MHTAGSGALPILQHSKCFAQCCSGGLKLSCSAVLGATQHWSCPKKAAWKKILLKRLDKARIIANDGF